MLNKLEGIELDIIDRARASVRGTHGSRDLVVGNSNIVAIDVCVSIHAFWFADVLERGCHSPIHDHLEDHFK
jgi:hypothetical protein